MQADIGFVICVKTNDKGRAKLGLILRGKAPTEWINLSIKSVVRAPKVKKKKTAGNWQ